MKINEIVKKLTYYTEELPKETLKLAIEHKEEIKPKLLEMLEYTKNNLEKIYNQEDNFFGYIYAIFLLAEFKETKAFPYLIDLISKDEKYVEYIIGEECTEYLPRLLASTYSGDDNLLFSIIENNELNEFIRSSTLQTFAILYLYGIKDREFIINYFKKLIKQKDDNDKSYLYQEILYETCHLRLIELENDIKSLFNLIENKEERDELKEELIKDSKINKKLYPFKEFYEYIYDTIGILEEWQCFRYKEDEEYENSNDYIVYEETIKNREEIRNNVAVNIRRNDLCYCGSGKKYKKCCMSKNADEIIEKLDFIDRFISKAEWYVKRSEKKKAYDLFRIAWLETQEICVANGIKSINQYDQEYKGYDSLSNWIQIYKEIVSTIIEEDEKNEILNSINKTFELNN